MVEKIDSGHLNFWSNIGCDSRFSVHSSKTIQQLLRQSLVYFRLTFLGINHEILDPRLRKAQLRAIHSAAATPRLRNIEQQIPWLLPAVLEAPVHFDSAGSVSCEPASSTPTVSCNFSISTAKGSLSSVASFGPSYPGGGKAQSGSSVS